MLLLVVLAVCALASPVTEYALKRDAHDTELVRFTLALVQRNVQELKELVMGDAERWQ